MARGKVIPKNAKLPTTTIGPSKPGQKAIKFRKGGLHQSLGVPQGTKIPSSKMAAAKSGSYGPKAEKQANFASALKSMRSGGK